MTQVDLPPSKASGLAHSVRLLKGIEGISVTRFAASDVVRHPLVQKIVAAYDAEAEDGASPS